MAPKLPISGPEWFPIKLWKAQLAPKKALKAPNGSKATGPWSGVLEPQKLLGRSNHPLPLRIGPFGAEVCPRSEFDVVSQKPCPACVPVNFGSHVATVGICVCLKHWPVQPHPCTSCLNLDP